jgi:hypothetical protein
MGIKYFPTSRETLIKLAECESHPRIEAFMDFHTPPEVWTKLSKLFDRPDGIWSPEVWFNFIKLFCGNAIDG